ncbi:MAG: hypothetical protein M1113_02370 [Candidatus Thermoplasmatota archaeon]|nr:hypothetical protein [Candidatus Thermoplasmatota archaeon]
MAIGGKAGEKHIIIPGYCAVRRQAEGKGIVWHIALLVTLLQQGKLNMMARVPSGRGKLNPWRFRDQPMKREDICEILERKSLNLPQGFLEFQEQMTK